LFCGFHCFLEMAGFVPVARLAGQALYHGIDAVDNLFLDGANALTSVAHSLSDLYGLGGSVLADLYWSIPRQVRGVVAASVARDIYRSVKTHVAAPAIAGLSSRVNPLTGRPFNATVLRPGPVFNNRPAARGSFQSLLMPRPKSMASKAVPRKRARKVSRSRSARVKRDARAPMESGLHSSMIPQLDSLLHSGQYRTEGDLNWEKTRKCKYYDFTGGVFLGSSPGTQQVSSTVLAKDMIAIPGISVASVTPTSQRRTNYRAALLGISMQYHVLPLINTVNLATATVADAFDSRYEMRIDMYLDTQCNGLTPVLSDLVQEYNQGRITYTRRADTLDRFVLLHTFSHRCAYTAPVQQVFMNTPGDGYIVTQFGEQFSFQEDIVFPEPVFIDYKTDNPASDDGGIGTRRTNNIFLVFTASDLPDSTGVVTLSQGAAYYSGRTYWVDV